MVNQFITKRSRSQELAIALLLNIIPVNLVAADTSSVDYIFLVDRNQHNCQQIGEEYQEIRTFETTNFYINICQKENNYYYLGEAKTGTIQTIFLPANALSPGEMYRASNGNVTYVITILPNEAILTIERNGVQVAIESSLQEQCTHPDDILKIQEGIASQMDYPLNDLGILPDGNYLQINQIDTIDNTINSNNVNSFNEINFLTEYNPETILNLQICKQ